VRGVARVPDKRVAAKGEDKAAEKATGGQRHGDAAIAAALAIYAAQRDVGDTTPDGVPRFVNPAAARGLGDFLGVGLRGSGFGDFMGVSGGMGR
ncbi:hypothetical protein, partial [Bacillus velezensis]|uniref:hypothetical protein n=1 Tax=Bacillus velezensis TaxID=492670 RepID=UPI00203F8B28